MFAHTPYLLGYEENYVDLIQISQNFLVELNQDLISTIS